MSFSPLQNQLEKICFRERGWGGACALVLRVDTLVEIEPGMCMAGTELQPRSVLLLF